MGQLRFRTAIRRSFQDISKLRTTVKFFSHFRSLTLAYWHIKRDQKNNLRITKYFWHAVIHSCRSMDEPFQLSIKIEIASRSGRLPCDQSAPVMRIAFSSPSPITRGSYPSYYQRQNPRERKWDSVWLQSHFFSANISSLGNKPYLSRVGYVPDSWSQRMRGK